MQPGWKLVVWWLAIVVGAASLSGPTARAQTKIRLGKAQAQNFAFVAADVGIAAGIFQRHGIDLEIANFGGDARLVQAMSADAIDVAFGGGPTIAFEVKGAPMLAIAVLADRPHTIMLVVAKDGPVKTEDDLKGRPVSVSTTGSLTYWLAQELSRSHGWGADGIKIVPLGTTTAQAAALKTRQVDGVVTETSTVLRLVEEGTGRILVRFGERIPEFHVHVVFARKAFIDRNPGALRNFVQAILESVQYMREHRDQTIDIAMRVAEVSKSVATANYEELMPIFNPTGRFDAKALDVLARSFVEMGLLTEKPDMGTLYTDAFLPKK
ncbi:MAG TPA: ABC transporter substrate-binding protein [Xanthobacteraceae bacterium]|nr:ABC transporter substrate-binding protein [Xanthobacteraceae bacterium]